MDEIDYAQQFDEFHRQKALTDHYRRRTVYSLTRAVALPSPGPHPDAGAAPGRGWGEYGICIDCDGRIEAARLAILPGAARCVNCQAKHERRRRE